jgi:hypothetical protein
LVNILKKITELLFLATVHSWNQKNKSYDKQQLISKYLNSNFGKIPGRLSDLLCHAIVGIFVANHALLVLLLS